MSLKSKLPQWVFLSIAKYFTGALTGAYVEGTEKVTDKADSIEIRIDGPDIREVSKGVYKVECEVNLLISTQMNAGSQLRHLKSVGKVVEAFKDIALYRYGDESEDTGYRLGVLCLKPLDNNSDKIQVANMGRIDPALSLVQTTVEGHYKIFIN